MNNVWNPNLWFMAQNSEDIQFHTPAQAGTDPIKISQHKFYAMQIFPGFWLVENI